MAFPLHLRPATRAAALLGPTALAAGAAAASAAAGALSELLGLAVSIEGRALSAPALPVAGLGRVSIALEAAGCSAALEVDARFVARVLERLGGEAARTAGARGCTALEQALLELCALAAVDGARSGPVGALVPRLALRGAAAEAGALAVALELAVGEERGRGRLLVPDTALRALSSPCDPSSAAAALPLDLALWHGTVTLDGADLAALAHGDVLLADPASAQALVLPGGLALRGAVEGALFHVQEIAMTETQASYPLTLSIEVARVTVTFGELARVEPGAVLALGARRDGAVVLRAGERALARGELVELDGGLGVRVLELEGRP